MKGTEKIIGHIQSDAEQQVREILDAAQAECAKIKADCGEKAAAAYAEKIRAGVKDCEARNESIDRICRMEAKKSILSLKQEMIAKCFDAAVEKLASLPEERYVPFLTGLAVEAAVTGEEELVLNARDRETIGPKLVEAANKELISKGRTGRLTLSDEQGSFAGGFILRQGNSSANCTAEILVSMSRSDMSATVSGILFD